MSDTFTTLSYVANVLVLAPICALLILKNPSMNLVYGEDTTARQILTSMYLTILILSIYFLFKKDSILIISWVIFGFQIIYKTLSLIIIKDKKVPVYWFNLAIVILHSLTLWMNPLY